MRTRVGVYIESLLEAGWLLALVVTPLFFNIYSHRVFEPDKLGILRTIATLMLAGAIALWIESLPPASERTPLSKAAIQQAWRYPLARPVLFVVLATLLATVLSVAPRVSLWGSYQRLQGLYTLLSYVVIFALMVRHLRRREQIARLCTTVILVSLPVALYGLIQHNGLDPLPWGGDVTERVASTMGNAIFVAAYLILVIPLTLARLVEMARRAVADAPASSRRAMLLGFGVLGLFQAWAWFALGFVPALWVNLLGLGLVVLMGVPGRRPLVPLALAGCYSLILTAQAVAVLLTGSRGPQVGLAGGLLMMGLLYAAARNRRKALAGLVGVGLLLTGLLTVMNLPQSPLAWMRDVPYIGRLGRVLELDQGTGRVRVLIWQGAVEMLADNPLRALIGHGPETMYVAYTPFYQPELAQVEARQAAPDRSHNETFDALITTGALGLAASLALKLGLFYHGLASLGLLPDRRSRITMGAWAGVGGILGAALPWVFEGTLRLSGVGLPLGIILGLAAHVIVQALRSGVRATPNLGWPQLLTIALLGALTAHWIEISVGIAIAVSRTYFWAYAALLVLLGDRAAQPEPALQEQARPAQRQRNSQGRGAPRNRRPSRARVATKGTAALPVGGRSAQRASLLAGALLLGVILVIMAWNLTTNRLGESGALSILLGALISSGQQGAPAMLSAGTLWMLIAVLAVGALVTVAELWCEDSAGPGGAAWWRGYGLCVALAGGMWLVYGMLHAVGLTPPVEAQHLLSLFLFVLFLSGLGLALALYHTAERARTKSRGLGSLLALPVLLVAMLLANHYNVTPVRADIIYKEGLGYDAEGRWPTAASLFEQAAGLAPREDLYWLFAGRAHLEVAREALDEAQRDAAIQVALEHLHRAQSLSPLNADHVANLARTYRTWAELTQQSDLRAERLDQALDYYEEAVAKSPRSAQLLNEWGQTHAQRGDLAAARALYERSLALDAYFAATFVLLGDLYSDQQAWNEARNYYEQALALSPTALYGLSRLAFVYAQMEDWDNAIAVNERILALAPDDYATLRNMVFLHERRGDAAEALRYLDLALEVAPAADAEGLRQLGQRLADEIAPSP